MLQCLFLQQDHSVVCAPGHPTVDSGGLRVSVDGGRGEGGEDRIQEVIGRPSQECHSVN